MKPIDQIDWHVTHLHVSDDHHLMHRSYESGAPSTSISLTIAILVILHHRIIFLPVAPRCPLEYDDCYYRDLRASLF